VREDAVNEFGHGEQEMADQAEHDQAEALRAEVEPLGQPSWEWIAEQISDPTVRHALADHMLQVCGQHQVLMRLFTQHHDEIEYLTAQGSAFLVALWRTKHEPL